MEDFITIATFSYTHEIEILKHKLNIEGIPYFFENETMLSVAPHYSVALGGIKLKVHPSDAEAVKKILDELNYNGNLRIV
jgi:hypothetical protein